MADTPESISSKEVQQRLAPEHLSFLDEELARQVEELERCQRERDCFHHGTAEHKERTKAIDYLRQSVPALTAAINALKSSPPTTEEMVSVPWSVAQEWLAARDEIMAGTARHATRYTAAEGELVHVIRQSVQPQLHKSVCASTTAQQEEDKP